MYIQILKYEGRFFGEIFYKDGVYRKFIFFNNQLMLVPCQWPRQEETFKSAREFIAKLKSLYILERSDDIIKMYRKNNIWGYGLNENENTIQAYAKYFTKYRYKIIKPIKGFSTKENPLKII